MSGYLQLQLSVAQKGEERTPKVDVLACQNWRGIDSFLEWVIVPCRTATFDGILQETGVDAGGGA